MTENLILFGIRDSTDAVALGFFFRDVSAMQDVNLKIN